MGRVGALVGSMSGDRVTPREDPSPHTVVVVDGGKDGARTSVWEPKDTWTDGKTLKEKRDILKWNLKLSLDTESNKDNGEGLNTLSTNGLTSANGAPGIKGGLGLGKEVNIMLSLTFFLLIISHPSSLHQRRHY